MMNPGSQHPTQTIQLPSYPQRVAQADIPPILNDGMPRFPVQTIQSSLCPQRSVQYTVSSMPSTGMPRYLAQATQSSLYCQCQAEATQSSAQLQHQALGGASSMMIPRNFQQPTQAGQSSSDFGIGVERAVSARMSYFSGYSTFSNSNASALNGAMNNYAPQFMYDNPPQISFNAMAVAHSTIRTEPQDMYTFHGGYCQLNPSSLPARQYHNSSNDFSGAYNIPCYSCIPRNPHQNHWNASSNIHEQLSSSYLSARMYPTRPTNFSDIPRNTIIIIRQCTHI
ncbi:hypothetical protein OCU04_006306 [Sclerotinia nivalis]|uniref:Uncharacterized protein n=1 Tax=Sclerotinia nivalis TaxID=352851 RepID=A0A9X0AMP5_9HELO|nr:hypothetical protein OCU04_006306 [Sclerotinia nivalis]